MTQEKLADLQADIEDAFDQGRVDAITELLSDQVALHTADADISEPGIRDYRAQVTDVIGQLRREGIHDRDREDIGSRLGLLCFSDLILASMVSMRDLVTAELIEVAVKTGYRDVGWGLAAAGQLTDAQERLEAQVALVGQLPDATEKLRLYDRMLKQQLPAMPVRLEQYEATERLAQTTLPHELLLELRQLTRGFTHDHLGGRPRSLAVIASRTEEPARSEIIAEALELVSWF